MEDDRAQFDAFVMVDWSASSSPGREGGQPNGIWIAVSEPGIPDSVVPARTRADAADRLIATCARLVGEGRRVLLGLDLGFGYPAGTAAALGAPPSALPWRWMWDLLALEVTDDRANDNDRFEAAAALNARLQAGAGPFWAHPPNRRFTDLAPTKGPFPVRTRSGVQLAEHRHTERWLRERGHAPKSLWQLAGAGAVGSQSLLGIPRLRQIRLASALGARCTVWPFEGGFTTPTPPMGEGHVVVAEVYPSLLDPPADLHPVRDAAQVLTLVAAYRRMALAGTLASAFATPDLPSDVLQQVVREEGWILGVDPTAAAEPGATASGRGLWDWEAEGAELDPDPTPSTNGAAEGDAEGTDQEWAAGSAADPAPADIRRGRLHDAADAPDEGEAFHPLISAGGTRVVEILSSASPHPTTDVPPPYDQEDDEWVLLLEGRAELDVDGRTHVLEPGDWLVIPARTPHRVTSTAAGTRWLAVHLG